MAYATQQDMITDYSEDDIVELTDRDAPFTGEVNAAVLATALEDASSTIDTYIRKRYSLPIAPVPTVLRQTCTAIAYYRLHRNRYADEVRVAYEDALNTLKQIAAGAIVLEVAGTESASAPAQSVVDMHGRQFSRKKKDWF